MDTENEITKINTVLFGVNGDNGINGDMKDLKEQVSNLHTGQQEIMTHLSTIEQFNNDIKQKKMQDWKKLSITVACIVGIVQAVVSFLPFVMGR